MPGAPFVTRNACNARNTGSKRRRACGAFENVDVYSKPNDTHVLPAMSSNDVGRMYMSSSVKGKPSSAPGDSTWLHVQSASVALASNRLNDNTTVRRLKNPKLPPAWMAPMSPAVVTPDSKRGQPDVSTMKGGAKISAANRNSSDPRCIASGSARYAHSATGDGMGCAIKNSLLYRESDRRRSQPENFMRPNPIIRRNTSHRNASATNGAGHDDRLTTNMDCGWAGKNTARNPASASNVSQGKKAVRKGSTR